jgi:hypothetical protein
MRISYEEAREEQSKEFQFFNLKEGLEVIII